MVAWLSVAPLLWSPPSLLFLPSVDSPKVDLLRNRFLLFVSSMGGGGGGGGVLRPDVAEAGGLAAAVMDVNDGRLLLFFRFFRLLLVLLVLLVLLLFLVLSLLSGAVYVVRRVL